jgi:hypothetical protein
VAYDLEVKLPGAKAAFGDGILSEAKAGIIARATTVLDPAEARQAEALVLGRAGRELPPAQVLAADQRVNACARELRQSGVQGSMDELRARAYLDLLLDRDSRLAAQDDDPGGAEQADGPGWP